MIYDCILIYKVQRPHKQKQGSAREDSSIPKLERKRLARSLTLALRLSKPEALQFRKRRQSRGQRPRQRQPKRTRKRKQTRTCRKTSRRYLAKYLSMAILPLWKISAFESPILLAKYLVFCSHPLTCALRLRDKSSKARELAVQLNELQIPHQEAILGSDACKCHSIFILWVCMFRQWQRTSRKITSCSNMLQRGLYMFSPSNWHSCPWPCLETRMEEGIFKHFGLERIKDIRMSESQKIEAASGWWYVNPCYILFSYFPYLSQSNSGSTRRSGERAGHDQELEVACATYGYNSTSLFQNVLSPR